MAAMRRFYEDILGFHCCGGFRQAGSNIGWATTPLALPGQAGPQQILQHPAAAPRFSWHSRSPRPKLISAPTSSCGRVSICSHRPPTRSLGIARCSSAIRTEICWRCLRTSSYRGRCHRSAEIIGSASEKRSSRRAILFIALVLPVQLASRLRRIEPWPRAISAGRRQCRRALAWPARSAASAVTSAKTTAVTGTAR